jgi:hypothetical protein
VNKETIVQFVCFTSILEVEKFIAIWEPYAKMLGGDLANSHLFEGIATKNGNRFNYVSQHICSAADFKFAFLKERRAKHFPEYRTRIIQAGGYLPVQYPSPYTCGNNDVRIMAFFPQGETPIDLSNQEAPVRVNTYEAYFENCAYGTVLEFFVSEQESLSLLQQLKAMTGVEAGIYKDCSIFQPLNKVVDYVV